MIAAGWTRRRVLAIGLAPAVLAGAGIAGLELVTRGVLPGRSMLEKLDGACSVASPPLAFSSLGPSFSGTFYSAARRRMVGYTIAYPPRHRPGDELPLVVMLHGLGGSHADALAGMSPAQGLALKAGGRPLAPMAMVTVDGGNGYWNPHPGDNPMGMVIDELIPLCQRLGLGRPPRRIATLGSRWAATGRYCSPRSTPPDQRGGGDQPGDLDQLRAGQAANAGAYASAAAFTANDAVTQPRRSAAPGPSRGGLQRSLLPGRPGTRRALEAPAGEAVVDFGQGCHDGSFFAAQEPPSLAFLAGHLTD